MLARLCRAIALAEYNTHDGGVMPKWSDYRDHVRAILQELKTPSEGMVEAGFPIAWQSSNELAKPDIIRGEVAEAFTAMIDAILSEGEG